MAGLLTCASMFSSPSQVFSGRSGGLRITPHLQLRGQSRNWHILSAPHRVPFSSSRPSLHEPSRALSQVTAAISSGNWKSMSKAWKSLIKPENRSVCRGKAVISQAMTLADKQSQCSMPFEMWAAKKNEGQGAAPHSRTMKSGLSKPAGNALTAARTLVHFVSSTLPWQLFPF